MGGSILEFEVYADSGEVGLFERVVGEAPQQGGLAYRAVADQDDLVLRGMRHVN